MSNSIKMDSLSLNRTGVQANTSISYAKEPTVKISGVKADSKDESVDTVLNISQNARMRLKNQVKNEGTVKKAGVTSARELFEIDALDTRNYMRGIGGCGYPSGALCDEWMRIDEPESYAKMQELEQKSAIYGRAETEEGRKFSADANSVRYDWFCRKCLDDDGWLKNPVTGKRSVVSALEALYSDGVHDTSVDAYDDSFSEKDASIWRFSTKFNVLMPMDMLNDLEMLNHMNNLSDEEKDKLQEKLDKIDHAVQNMKEAEINYEGDLKYLRFGVKFDSAGNATYHANYTGCEDKNGIMADSAEELLKMLMSK